MYNLTLKDRESNNVLFVATQGGSASSPAAWVHDTGVTATSPVISMQVRDNGPKTARRVRITLQQPAFNSLCEESCELHTLPVSIELVIPKVIDRNVTYDVVAYLAALFADANFSASIASGYTPA